MHPVDIDAEEIKDQAYENARERATQDHLKAVRSDHKSAIEGGNGDSSEDPGQPGTATSEKA
jgi:hypothetical protein